MQNLTCRYITPTRPRNSVNQFDTSAFIRVFRFIAPCENSDWQYRKGYCYWSSTFNNGMKRLNSWFGAQIDCREKGANLVSIHSESENGFIHKKTHCAETWNGLTVVDARLRTKPEGHAWIDGSSRTYLNWYPGRPSKKALYMHVLWFRTYILECYSMDPNRRSPAYY